MDRATLEAKRLDVAKRTRDAELALARLQGARAVLDELLAALDADTATKEQENGPVFSVEP